MLCSQKTRRNRKRKQHFEKYLPATTFHDITTQEICLFFISCFLFNLTRPARRVSETRFGQEIKKQQSTNDTWKHEGGLLVRYGFFLLRICSVTVLLRHLTRTFFTETVLLVRNFSMRKRQLHLNLSYVYLQKSYLFFSHSLSKHKHVPDQPLQILYTTQKSRQLGSWGF